MPKRTIKDVYSFGAYTATRQCTLCGWRRRNGVKYEWCPGNNHGKHEWEIVLAPVPSNGWLRGWWLFAIRKRPRALALVRKLHRDSEAVRRGRSRITWCPVNVIVKRPA